MDLKAAPIPILGDGVCKQPQVYGDVITDGMFCAGSLDEGIDACDGDSGGPLVCGHDGKILDFKAFRLRAVFNFFFYIFQALKHSMELYRGDNIVDLQINQVFMLK